MNAAGTAAVLDALLRYELADVPAPVSAWISTGRLAARLRQEIEAAAVRLNDRRFARHFMATCPVPGAQPQDYNYRLLALQEGHAMVSIRFKGLDVNQPFVEVVYRDMPLDTVAQALDLAGEIAQGYAIFAPRWIRVHDNAGHLANAADGVIITCDFRHLAAPLQALRERPLPPRYNDVSLEVVRDLDFLPTYRAAYEAFLEDNPGLRGIVQPAAQQDLAALAAESALYRVTIDDSWAGLIAARRATRRYLQGYCIVEEVLAPGFRGRGYAAAVQRRLVECLSDAGDDLLFGQINPLNVASRRAALAAGRVDVSGSYFIQIES